MPISREAFLNAELKTKTVDVAGLGEVEIRQLTKSELCEFQKWLRPKGELNEDRYAMRDLRLICMAVTQPQLTIDDMDAVSKLPGSAMDELAYQVMVINGYMMEIDEDALLGKSDS